MIAKIKTGKFFKGAFKYNLDKIEEGSATLFYHSMFNKEAPSFADMQVELLERSQMCPNISNPVFHTSLNFSPDEYLEDETLQSIVDDYMERLGYGSTPYVVFKHNDTNHQHVHIISSNIELVNGKYRKINDSYLYRKSESISRSIELDYNLIIATDVVRRREELNRLIPELEGYGEVATYEHLKNVSEFIVSEYKFSDLGGLNSLLNRYNIACFKNRDFRGSEYYKFTFQNPATRKNVGVGGTPSQLGLSFTSDKLKQLIEDNRQDRLIDVEVIKQWKDELLSKYLFVTEKDLGSYLTKKGLIKIDREYYLDRKSRAILRLGHLRLPSLFINIATLKKEYFQNITKSATEYRKQVSVFHESTMFSDVIHLNGFKNFFFKQETHLSSEQKSLLFESFVNYKSKIYTKLELKEHEKDTKQINKMFDYVSSLNISEKTAISFLELFNISISGNKVIVGNSVDRVLHELDFRDLKSFSVNGDDRTSELASLNSQDLAFIGAAINDRSYKGSYSDVNLQAVSCFIPEDYAIEHNLEDRLNSTISNVDEFVPDDYESGPSLRFFSSDYSGLVLNKKKKKGDNDDIKRKKKIKR